MKNKKRQVMTIEKKLGNSINNYHVPTDKSHGRPLIATINPAQTINSRYRQQSLNDNLAVLSKQLQNLQNHKLYYNGLMNIQRQRYVNYYEQIFAIVHHEYYMGLLTLDACINQMLKDIEYKENDLLSIINLMKNKGKLQKIDNMVDQLEENGHVAIEIAQIELQDIELFKEDFKKYVIMPSFKQEPTPDETPGSSKGTQERGTSKNLEEIGTQTDLVFELSEPQMSARDQLQDLLSCDEELGVERGFKLSASSRRRRKYAVGRRDVIREEDEFSQSSSIVSES